jgi:GntR family transcriptional regulator / MocR family aminotransferase
VPESWSGWGQRFLVSVDRDRSEPIHGQVEAGLRSAIRSGRLAAGELLPSSRLLAEELGVSRGVVQGCYEQLVAEGYLAARTGSGTRVADRAGTPAPAHPPEPPVRPRFAVADFRPSVPDLASFPRQAWLRSGQQALTQLSNASLGYPDAAGSHGARTVLADYLRRVRAADTTPDRVVLCSGFAQGLSITVRTLAARGLTDVAVEDPGYGPDDGLEARALSVAGVRLHRVPVDEHGLDVEALARTPARVVVVTPAHQSPTGVLLGPQRRQALLGWAESRDGYVIEDDYDSEFRYDRQAIGTLQGLGTGRVFLIGTASKTLAPALRIGWVLAPPEWARALVQTKELDDRGSPTLNQETFAVMVRSGRYDRHLRLMRRRYLQRRDLLVTLLSGHAPHLRVSGLAAGLNLVTHLPTSTSESVVIEEAAARGVGLYGMNRYLATPSAADPRLVLGFGNTTDREIRAGLAAIADLLHP